LTVRRMHADEVETDFSLVRRLLAGQFPEWAELPLERVPSAGTDNALYRLGDDMVVRLPRIHWAVGGVAKDLEWLPILAPLLPVEVPVPLAKGEPAEGYPWEWGVYPWLGGENPSPDAVSTSLALEVARFLEALHGLDLPDGPASFRGEPLATRDEATRAAIADLQGQIDTDRAIAVWEAALAAPAWSGPPVWVHSDVLPGNLLVQAGRLTGVIDFSGLGLGDPACDLMIAWALFSGEARMAFREALRPDGATWARGRGHALSQAAIFIPYYVDTNPVGVRAARRSLDEALADRD
jgi:aminoglycoside phosphotransferase (APT) family kinase protein